MNGALCFMVELQSSLTWLEKHVLSRNSNYSAFLKTSYKLKTIDLWNKLCVCVYVWGESTLVFWKYLLRV
jgi:hypothetical protein